jgi:ArsR family transcriptional regulator, zinc-responsive transcriptional repressor
MICNTYKQFFSSLSDLTRLEIIALLRRKRCTVSEISNGLKMEQSRVSHNLKKLKDVGIVKNKVNGKERLYSIHPGIKPLFKQIDKHVDVYYKHYCKCKGKAKQERWSGK